ncbi:CvpA family protein [Buchnera aphidicola]|uniref:CvpA family protein n=1 Tax=Buchnera aphidicola TaxID=9 RepID=UPI0021C58CAD|nr:CvpA family protein [Buchnera aphidicola]
MHFSLEKIIKKIKLSYYNIILGGLFGIFRSVILVLLFLFVFSLISKNNYNFYISHSILISIFFKTIKYFLLIFDDF